MTHRTIGRYQVIGLLGAGGIGQVYAARDPELGRMVAIKALRPEFSSNREFLERFRAEAASLAGLSHPNITTLYDLQPVDQQLFMVMELVRGHTLETVLARCKRLGLREALAVVAQAAMGLGHAHRMDVIHRDIKPANLMLTESGLLKIMDFGIARVRGSQRLTRAGSIVGTLAYVAPEQIKGAEGDERSDLYSLACVVYEMLSGDPPFQADTEYAMIHAQVEAPPRPLAESLPDIPPAVEQALQRSLAKDPNLRFASVEEFSRALGAEAIQGQAASVLRDNVLPLAGAIAPQPIPETDRGVAASTERGASSGNTRRPIHADAPSDKMPATSRNRTPVIVLASVSAVLVLGSGYMFWGPSPAGPAPNPDVPKVALSTPPEPTPTGQNDTTSASPPNAGSGTPSSTAFSSGTTTASVATPPPAVSGGAKPPNGLFLPGPGSNQPNVVQRKQMSQSDALLLPPMQPPGNPNPSPPQIQPALAPVQPPQVKPAYAGRVSNWLAADTLFVPEAGKFGFRELHLFGVADPGVGKQEAERQRHQLNAFIATAGNSVMCYTRGSNTFQCFAGKQDIALWAIQHGLARLSADAPEQYQEALP